MRDLLWPEGALAPQALWPDDGPAAPLGDDLSPSPPASPTSPCYSPFPFGELANPGDTSLDPAIFDALELD